MKIRVYYEDTDLGGIVYHSKYLNFCERARSEIFFEAGKSPVYEDYHFVVKELHASYHKAAYFADILEVKTTLQELSRISATLHQSIWRGEELIFELVVTLVCLRGERPARIPDYFLELFQKLS